MRYLSGGAVRALTTFERTSGFGRSHPKPVRGLTAAGRGSTSVEGVEREFRGFPFQTITKRIADSEYGFFVPVFALLANNAAEARLRRSPE
jgi:hypothetical protein